MSLIEAHSIEFHTGTASLFHHVDLKIEEGDRIGLIGPNGAGKTTLVRVLLGELDAGGGRIRRKKDLSWGYVPQNPAPPEGHNIVEYLLTDWAERQRALEDAEAGLAENPEDTAVLKNYEGALDAFEKAGGYEAESRSEKLLGALGLDNNPGQRADTLSGGELSLLTFARSLLREPELLILDEPGNHLDYLGLAWLENFLLSYKGAVLVISHNRYLLDKVCRTLWSVEKGEWTVFSGSYSDFRRERFREVLEARHDRETALKRIEKLDRRAKELNGIVSSQYNPPKTLQVQLAQTKRKLADEREALRDMPARAETIEIHHQAEGSRSRIALEIKKHAVERGGRTLYTVQDLFLPVGSKTALLGKNGSGKTSLIEDILSRADWDGGDIRIGPGLRTGYLKQSYTIPEDRKTLIEEVRSWGALSEDEAFKLITPYQFTWEDRLKPPAVLSGGEKNRLQLARLMYLRCDFLILDEPTNHMDLASREIIGQALKDFPGTILVVSHDRYFLDQLVTSVFEISGGTLVGHQGNFSDFFRVRYSVLPPLSGRLHDRRRLRESEDGDGNNAKADEALIIEERIQEREKEKVKLEKELQNAVKYKNTEKGRELSDRLGRLEKRLAHDYEQWETALGS